MACSTAWVRPSKSTFDEVLSFMELTLIHIQESGPIMFTPLFWIFSRFLSSSACLIFFRFDRLFLIKLSSFLGYSFARLFGTGCWSNTVVSCNVACFMYFLKLLNRYASMETGKYHDLLSCSDEGSNLLIIPLLFRLIVPVTAMFWFTFSWCILAVLFRAGSGEGGFSTG